MKKLEMAKEVIFLVEATVIAVTDALIKTVRKAAKRIRLGIKRNPASAAQGVLVGMLAFVVVIGGSALIHHIQNLYRGTADNDQVQESQITEYDDSDFIVITTTGYSKVKEPEPIIEEYQTESTRITEKENSLDVAITTTAVTTMAPETQPNIELLKGHDQISDYQNIKSYDNLEKWSDKDIEMELNRLLSFEDKYLLCNLVGREYGTDYVPIEEKCRIVAVVMNRVNNDEYHDAYWEFGDINSIREAIEQPGQFDGEDVEELFDYRYSDRVTRSCQEAVIYYFHHSGNYTADYYYYGDNSWNYFFYDYSDFRLAYYGY